MNKLALSVLVAPLAIAPVLSQAAQTNNVNVNVLPTYGANISPEWQDNFFVAGQLGQVQYSGKDSTNSLLNHKGTLFGSARAGWRWNGIVGPEIGYAYLGNPRSDKYKGIIGVPTPYGPLKLPTSGTFDQTNQALLLGLNGKFNVYKGLFVTAHGGYLYSQTENELALQVTNPLTGKVARETSKGTVNNGGWYAGVGVGYDLTRNFSVGLNYDNYNVQTVKSVPKGRTSSVNLGTYSAMVEYRF